MIGSTSTRGKGQYLVEELGHDAVVTRDAGPVQDQLRAVAPDGIDAIFDNVGGNSCWPRWPSPAAAPGSVSSARCPPRRWAFSVPRWFEEFSRGLRNGTLTFPHTRLPGIDQAPRALCELLEGRHAGTVLVEL